MNITDLLVIVIAHFDLEFLHALRSYQDLIGWQKAIELVTDIYRLTQSFPREEMYGLTSQICRAAVSIRSNIAEGQGR